VMSLAELGYRVTVAGLEEHLPKRAPLPEWDSWAQLQQASVEIMTMERLLAMYSDPSVGQSADGRRQFYGRRRWRQSSTGGWPQDCGVVSELLSRRPQFYDKIIISRPTLWSYCWKRVAKYCNKPDRHLRKQGVGAPTSGTCSSCPSGGSYKVGALLGSTCNYPNHYQARSARGKKRAKALINGWSDSRVK